MARKRAPGAPEFVVTAREDLGVEDDARYHVWIMGGAGGERALRRGVQPSSVGAPTDVDVEAAPAIARIDAGRWLADCANPRCNSAMMVLRGATGFMCGDCFNADLVPRRYRPLVWPDDATVAEVERIMLDGRRTELGFMHWRPGKSVAELDAEGPFHHSWTAPKTYTVGAIGTAAEMNTHVRDNLLETAAAKATAAGEVPYATAANSLAMLAPVADELIGFNAGATALEAKGVNSMARVGTNTAEQTTTSTTAVDLVSISSLSIAVTKPILIVANYRKTTGAAAVAALGLKLNSTVVTEADAPANKGIARTTGDNQAQSGLSIVWIGPRRASYSYQIIPIYFVTGGSAATGGVYAGAPDAAIPNATITDVIIRGEVANGAVTLAVQDVRVYELGD